MDALQIVASATQIVSCMVGAVRALKDASVVVDDAPTKIQTLESFASDLENLTRRAKLKHGHKLHDSRLEQQLQSLHTLVDRLHHNIRKMSTIASKNKAKKIRQVIRISLCGDPLSKLINSVQADLNCWLELQTIAENVAKSIDSAAENAPPVHRIKAEKGFPVSIKCSQIRTLLEQEDSRQVILIVGLSGIGKSCLARQVASNPPNSIVDGAVELVFGQWCSRAASYGSEAEYQKRLSKKLYKLLVKLGFMKVTEDLTMDLDDVCCMLQTALAGKSILLLLDDVWEQDIVDRFTKLYDNHCKYLVTTRNEGVYEITEAEKIEITKDDSMEMSKEILLYHSLLSREELPSVAGDLLDRCGHHPLTVAVMGKALRKETSSEKWKKAISNLSSYAKCAPGPVSYVNEKSAENKLTIFGSFEYSLQDMPEDSRMLFTILAAISWPEPVPEVCLEALWFALGHRTFFPVVVSKLVEGSLLMKLDLGYHVHDMVSLYLESKVSSTVETLITGSSDRAMAVASPWLFVFGNDQFKSFAEEKMNRLVSLSHEKEALVALESMAQALMASKSISELEASSKSFRRLVGPKVPDFISLASPSTIVALSKVVAILFSKNDFFEFAYALENTKAVDNLLEMLRNCSDPVTQISIFNLVAKIAEHGSGSMINKVLKTAPMEILVELLSPNYEQWHDHAFATIMALSKAGKSDAVKMMVNAGIDKSMIDLLEHGSDVSQHHAMVVLKVFYEMDGSLGCILPGGLDHLPWHARIRLERLVSSDQSSTSSFSSPKPQSVDEIFERIMSGDRKQILKAAQDLVPIIDKNSRNPRILDRILQCSLVENLVNVLKSGSSDQERMESTFLLMKLGCWGGDPIIQELLNCDIVLELVKTINHGQSTELQDSAYTALHQMVFTHGENKILKQMLNPGVLEKLIQSLSAKSIKTREIGMLLVLDMVEMGSKSCLERILSLQGVEKLVGLEKSGGVFRGVLVNLLKGLDKCKNLSSAERRVMRHQVARKIKVSLKGHKIEWSVMAAVEDYLSEGSWGSSSGSGSGGRSKR